MRSIGRLCSLESARICFLHRLLGTGVALCGRYRRVCGWQVQERTQWVEKYEKLWIQWKIIFNYRRFLDFYHLGDCERLRFFNHVYSTRFIEANVEEGFNTDCFSDDLCFRNSDRHRLFPRGSTLAHDAKASLDKNRERNSAKEDKRSI